MTKVDIISGFLGAGKTTLIRELLADGLNNEQIVLIENEFGEIGIDSGFLKDAGVEIREMNQGCICCSLVGDFGTALGEVAEKYHPDRIVIEPSGVGKLSDVIRAVEGVKEQAQVEVNSTTTVVDVLKCKMYLKNFGEFFKNQVESAGTIILSRTDTEKATPEKIEQALEILRPLNPDATIITTPVSVLGGAKVLETMEGVKIDISKLPEEHHHHHHHHDEEHEHHHHHDDEEHEHHHHHHHDGEECSCGCHHDEEHDHHHHHDEEHGHHHHHDEEHEHHHHHHDGEECSCGHHHHHHEGGTCSCGHDHDADEVFTSWGKETIRKYSVEEIRDILEKMSESSGYGLVLRAKGMVESNDGQWIYFDMVPGEVDVRYGEPEYTGRLCVIGSELKEDKIAGLFGF